MNTKSIAALAGIAALATTASAAPVLYATSGSYMYRVDLNADQGSAVTETQLDAMLVSLTVGNNGELWGTERYDSSGDGNHAIFRVDNIDGTPVATQQGDFLQGYNSSIVNINGTLTGFKDSTREMIAIDPENDTYTVLGSYAGLPFTPASSGFDAQTQSTYGLKNDELYRFDSAEGIDNVLNTQKIADVDFGGLAGAAGGEIVDGVYYHAIVADLVMHIFTIDMQTGATEELLSFSVRETGALGLAGYAGTVPTPGTLALLGLGGMLSTRRRR